MVRSLEPVVVGEIRVGQVHGVGGVLAFVLHRPEARTALAETLSVLQLYRMFPDEESCRNWLEQVRWGGTPACPRCGSIDEIGPPPASKPHGYWCKPCRKHFTVTTSTCLHSTKKPLQDWIYTIYSVLTARKGVSAMQLSKELGCQYRTAWHMLHRVREACTGGDFTLDKIVEVDETYIGGKERNKHDSKKLKQGRGTVGKIEPRGRCPRTRRQGNRPARRATALHDAAELDLILCEHHVRKLTKNLTVKFECREYQVTGRGRGYRLRGAAVTVCKGFDGSVTVLRAGRALPVRLFAEGEAAAAVEDGKTVRGRVDRIKAGAARAPGLQAGAGSSLAAGVRFPSHDRPRGGMRWARRTGTSDRPAGQALAAKPWICGRVLADRRAPSGPCGQPVDNPPGRVAHRLPTLARLSPTTPPLHQQIFFLGEERAQLQKGTFLNWRKGDISTLGLHLEGIGLPVPDGMAYAAPCPRGLHRGGFHT